MNCHLHKAIMPVRRGHLNPQNSFIDAVIRKFDGFPGRNFIIGNALTADCPIIYCSAAFCQLSGFEKHDIVQRNCSCDFLYGPETDNSVKELISEALTGTSEVQAESNFYKKNGTMFKSNVHVLPIKNKHGRVIMYLLNHKQLYPEENGNASKTGLPSRKDSIFFNAFRRNTYRKTNIRMPLLIKQPTTKEQVIDNAPARIEYPGLNSIGIDNKDIHNANRQFSIDFRVSTDPMALSLQPSGTTNKVAQVMSLGSDVLPEYKVESPKIHPWTILHYSPFKAIWDWVVLFLVMYTAIMTPYMAAFVLWRGTDHSGGTVKDPQSIVEDPLVIVDYIVDVMFIVDIFINFRTTFVDSNDEVVSEPCRVAANYMKGWFLVDLLAAVPFELLIIIGTTDQTTTLIGLLKTARLLRLVRVARKLDSYSEYGTASLLLLMFGFALIAHWLACIWYAIGASENSPHRELGWLSQLATATKQPFNESLPHQGGPDLQTKYLTALYFTLSSLTSVGFGNVSANTNAEKIFSILIMFLGALMHAIIFGNVTAIIQRLYSGMAHYHSTMRRVRDFIRFYQIPSPLRQRLEDYSQYDYSYTNGIDMNEVLRHLPEGLQADICLHLNRNLLSCDPAFRACTPGCLRSLSLKLTTTHCPPEDYIIHNGDELTSLSWIGRGTVEIIQNETIIAILGKCDSFGENFGLVANRMTGKSRASVRALTYCDLHSISRQDLLAIMRAYPEFHRSFNESMQVTYDLRDLDIEEKDLSSSITNLHNQRHFRQSSRKDSLFGANDDKLCECSPPDNRSRDSVHETRSRKTSCACAENNAYHVIKERVDKLEKTLGADLKLILKLLRNKETEDYAGSCCHSRISAGEMADTRV